MQLFLEEIYKFYENPKNLKEFEEWKKAKEEKITSQKLVIVGEEL